MLQRIVIRNKILWLRDKISYVGLAVIWFLNSVYLESRLIERYKWCLQR